MYNNLLFLLLRLSLRLLLRVLFSLSCASSEGGRDLDNWLLDWPTWFDAIFMFVVSRRTARPRLEVEANCTVNGTVGDLAEEEVGRGTSVFVGRAELLLLRGVAAG